MAPRRPQTHGQLFDPGEVMNEKQWQKVLTERLKEEDYLVQHIYKLKTAAGTWRTSTTASGFPDLVAFRGGYVLAIEVKGPRGRARPEQIPWLETFADIPTGRAWLLDPIHTPWQDIANWIHRPETAPRTHGFVPTRIYAADNVTPLG